MSALTPEHESYIRALVDTALSFGPAKYTVTTAELAREAAWLVGALRGVELAYDLAAAERATR